ncbi:MAG: hypothetical protein AABY15_01160 [Nanoarchaeota archaeon]
MDSIIIIIGGILFLWALTRQKMKFLWIIIGFAIVVAGIYMPPAVQSIFGL